MSVWIKAVVMGLEKKDRFERTLEHKAHRTSAQEASSEVETISQHCAQVHPWEEK